MIEERRIIEIYVPADGSVGSGYLLTPSLVLTARHVVDAALPGSGPLVVPDDDGGKADVSQLSAVRPGCRVRSLGSPPGSPFSDAIVVWWASDADVALLAVVADEALTTPPVPGITWSDLLGGDPVEVTATGFPDAVVQGDVRESRQIVGRVTPLSGAKAGRWVIQAEGSIGAVPVGSLSAWAGMSGAAVFAGDCLIGIVEVDADPDHPERLELWALPARKFASDPELAGWLRWDGGVDAWAIASSPPMGALALLRQVANEQRKDAGVSGGQVGGGNYATVFQSFEEAKRPVSSFIRSAQFRSLIDERTKGFIGREFIFDGIRHALAGEEFASGYVMIRGEPGIGKTAIASILVLRGSYVHHFNIAPDNIRSPRQFLENVCAQLIVRYGLDHPALPPQAGEDSGFLSQLLTEAADQARQRDELPVVVVVDALDEAEDTGLAPAANRLYLPRALPAGVFFVLTTREEADYRLDVDNETEIWLRDDDPANEQDVARYIESFIDANPQAMRERIQAWDLEPAAFVTEITKLSEGNFMYLVYVLRDIAAGRLSRQTVGGISGLPRGLTGYYRRHWRDMKDADPGRFSTLQRPVLCFLAISREPVAIPQLMEWTHLDPGDIKDVITEWREFLNEDPDTQPPRYRIYHRSFAEFLDDRENLRWYHSQIATTALSKIPGFPSR